MESDPGLLPFPFPFPFVPSASASAGARPGPSPSPTSVRAPRVVTLRLPPAMFAHEDAGDAEDSAEQNAEEQEGGVGVWPWDTDSRASGGLLLAEGALAPLDDFAALHSLPELDLDIFGRLSLF